MLRPAIRYKDILLKKFSEVIYTEDYFLYYGYPYGNSIPEIKDDECRWQWAIVDPKKASEEDAVIGYLAYRLDTVADRICQFGLYSFDKGNIIVARDTFDKLEELISTHHSVEWRMISCNPAKRNYDKFCKDHHGSIFKLSHITKDQKGNFIDEYIYEIVNKETVESL